LEQAKALFSEVVRLAREAGPQRARVAVINRWKA